MDSTEPADGPEPIDKPFEFRGINHLALVSSDMARTGDGVRRPVAGRVGVA